MKNLLPILKSSSEVYILYSTEGKNLSTKSKVFFVSIHNCSCGDDFLNSACCREITLKSFSHSLCCILFYLINHQSKELIPFSLEDIICRIDRKFLLSLVSDECTSKCFRIIVDVFRKVKHNCDPNVIGCEFYVSVIVVCIVNC